MTKGNDGAGNIADRDEWETPQWLWIKLNNQYPFSFDCCAKKHNAKCMYSNDFLKTTDMLNIHCWMNPPFSKAKEMFEHFFKVVKKGVAIYRFDNPETKLWQYIYDHADWIFVFDKRINYEGYLAFEVCGPVLVDHKLRGTDEVDKLAKAALAYMKKLIRTA